MCIRDRNNLVGISLFRVDNPFIQTAFTIFAFIGLYCGDNGYGPTNKLRISNADFDRGAFGIIIDAAATIQGGCISSQPETGLSDSAGLVMGGTGALVNISNLDIRNTIGNSLRVEGTNNTLTVTNFTGINFDMLSTGFPCVEVTASNRVNLTNIPYITLSLIHI